MQETYEMIGYTVYSYGLVIAAAALAYLMGMGIAGYRRGLPVGTARVFGVLAVPLCLFFARLIFCLFNLSLFTETYESPWLMLRFFDGGLSMAGVLLGLVLATWIASRLMKVRFGGLLDVATLPLGLFLAACRAAEDFTTLGVGKVVEESMITQSAPWLFLTEVTGIATEYRLAVYRYETLAGIALFVFMLCLSRVFRKSRDVRPGDASLLFFSLYGAIQVVLESMRDDGHMLLIFLRVSQVFAALLPVLATGVFTARHISIRGRADRRILFSWAILLLAILGGVALEFSLDGRFTWGMPTLFRDYALLAILSAALFAVPCSLFRLLRRKVYREGYIKVHGRITDLF